MGGAPPFFYARNFDLLMLSSYGKKEWLTILAVGLVLTVGALAAGLWWAAILVIGATAALASFFRDPERRIPTQRGAMVAPADGRISSIHELDYFEPLGGPAVCIRIFLSVLNVHINRSPCHARAASITHKDGQYLNALNPQSAEVNESNLIVLHHPIRQHVVAAVRQVSGMLARTIVCGVRVGDTVQRGQRIGMIKLGSTTELYIPKGHSPRVAVEVGQKVKAGLTVLATVMVKETGAGGERSADGFTSCGRGGEGEGDERPAV